MYETLLERNLCFLLSNVEIMSNIKLMARFSIINQNNDLYVFSNYSPDFM